MKKPLVIDSGQIQQLQGETELDIPLDQRFRELQQRYVSLLLWLAEQGFDVPDEQLQYAEDNI